MTNYAIPGHPDNTEVSALRDRRVAVIGGGILGMYLAWQLRDRGAEVTVFERAPRTGGLASPAKIGSYVWDRFYHVMLMSDQNLMRMLDRLALTPQLRWGKTRTGFLTNGQLHSMSNALEFLRFPPLRLLDKFRLGATIFWGSKIRNWRKLEGVLAIDWLRRWSGETVLEQIWLPLLKSKLGNNYRYASAAFIWAIIARLYAARRAGLKQEMFGYVEGGYSTILNRLQDELDAIGVTTLYDARVSEVNSDAGTVWVKQEVASPKAFDHAILTVPTNVVTRLCPGLTAAETERLEGVTYQGIICPSFLLTRGLSPFYVTNITDTGIPFTGVIEMTALVDPRNFDGKSLVYLPIYLTQQSPYWQKQDDDVLEDCISAMERTYPDFRRDQIAAMQVSRARQVLAISTLHYSTRVMPEIETSLENVYVLNTAQIPNGTLNVNETIGLVDQNIDVLQGAMQLTHRIRYDAA